MKKTLFILIISAFATGLPAAGARDTISIVGSSTVFPFAAVVAERFGKLTDFRAPKVEANGSGSGFILFCKGVGGATPDITNSSRRIKRSEYDLCRRNGITEIVEVMIGYDGIVLAGSRHSDPMNLTRRDLYLALAKWVPGPAGAMVENPHATWKEVNPLLPDVRIEVLGPPPTSGTRDVFVELALEGGARSFPDIKALAALPAGQQRKIEALALRLGVEEAWASLLERKGSTAAGKDLVTIITQSVREDGTYVETGENDNLIVTKLVASPGAVGIFGFNFLDQNSDKIQGFMLDGKQPTFEVVAAPDYPLRRPLYFYAKKAHFGAVPGIVEYLRHFTSKEVMGTDGYLTEKGLIALDGDRYIQVLNTAKTLPNLQL